MRKSNITLYIITAFLCVFLGAAGMYGMIHFFPSVIVDTVTKTIKDVTVTDEGIAEGIANIYDATLTVQNYRRNTLQSIGSGFVYDEEGYIMTNHHVIDGAEEVKVMLSNGETILTKVIGSDEYADIAVLKIDKAKVLDVAKIGNSENLQLGDTLFTIGTPKDLEYAGTVTRGILSGKDRMVEVSISSTSKSDWIMNVMQTDAAINPGNSGGPLCNVSGEVVGINSLKIVESTIEGLGFAIPIEDALEYAKKIVNGESIRRSYLGINMADFSYPSYFFQINDIEIDSSITSGVVVMDVEKNSPVHKAGIKKGDVIINIAGNVISNIAELKFYLYKHEPGEKVKLTVMRGKDKKEFDVTLGEGE